LVSVLLGITLVCLIVLLYFSSESETDEQAKARSIVEKRRRSRPGCIGCINGPYYCGWLRSIRTGTCLASFAAQLGTRIYYGTQIERSLCQTTAYTTQTGLLYLWPLAMVGTLLAAYTADSPVPTPVRFGQYSYHEKHEKGQGLTSQDDASTSVALTASP
jgi:hypothetical protein